MINFYHHRENRKKHNPNRPQISNHLHRILIIGGSGYGKTNALLNLISHQPDIYKTYLYAKGPYEAKYEYSNDIDHNHIYENIDDYNPNKKHKILIMFDDMIADMLSKKRLQPMFFKLFIEGRKLNIFLVFIKESYLTVTKNNRLNSPYYFIINIP